MSKSETSVPLWYRIVWKAGRFWLPTSTRGLVEWTHGSTLKTAIVSLIMFTLLIGVFIAYEGFPK